MRKKNRNRKIAGKVIAAAVVGSAIGATVGLLMAPTSGQEMRRRVRSSAVDAREKLKSAVGNVETQARELAGEVNQDIESAKKSVARRKKAASTAMG